MRLRHLHRALRAILVLVGRSSGLLLAWIFAGIACQGPEAFNGGDAGGPILTGAAGSGSGIAGASGASGSGGAAGFDAAGSGGTATVVAGSSGASGSAGAAGGGGGAGQGGSGGAGRGGSGGAGGVAGANDGGGGIAAADAGADVTGASGSGGAAGGSCTGVAAYMLGKVYTPGERAQSSGRLYQCRPFPNSGWCGISDAYSPGTGFAWMDAWMLVGPCN